MLSLSQFILKPTFHFHLKHVRKTTQQTFNYMHQTTGLPKLRLLSFNVEFENT